MRDLAKLVFSGMAGRATMVGSEMAAHMPALWLISSEQRRHGDVVELGVGEGWSTVSLLGGMGREGFLTSYDTSDRSEALTEMGVPEQERAFWRFMLEDSVDAAQGWRDGSIGLLFIDTLHTYDRTRRELGAWLPKMAPGGAISGHDYYLDKWEDVLCGVKRAVDEFALAQADRFRLQVLPHDQGLFILWPK